MSSPAAVPRRPIEDDVKEDLPPLSITRIEEEKNAEPRIADEVIAAHPEANEAFPVYERINERFYKGRYAGIEIMIDSTDGFICATKMFGSIPVEKWKKRIRTRNLIKRVEKDLNDAPPFGGATNGQLPDVVRSNERISAIKILGTGFKKQFTGTWIHEVLVLDFALWKSYTYYKQVHAIIKAVEIRHQTEELRKRDLKIAELETKNKQLSVDKKTVEYATALTEDESHDRYVALLHAEEELANTRAALDSAADQRAVIDSLAYSARPKLVIVRYPPNADGVPSHCYRFFIVQGVSDKTVDEFLYIDEPGSRLVLVMTTILSNAVFKTFQILHTDIIVDKYYKDMTMADHIDTRMMLRMIITIYETFKNNMKEIESQNPLNVLIGKA